MIRERLIGSWRPQRWEWSSGGDVLFATENLQGILIYAPDGMMAVQVAATRGKPAQFLRSRGHGVWLTMKRWFFTAPGIQWGYSGRYEVDEAQACVRHFIEVRSLAVPRQPVLERKLKLNGDQLQLEFEDRHSRDCVTWRRVNA